MGKKKEGKEQQKRQADHIEKIETIREGKQQVTGQHVSDPTPRSRNRR